jgi:hypothetical protein
MRVFAFAMLVVFHLTTHLLFDIGMFPFIMTATATVIFAPDWPRKLLGRLRVGRVAPVADLARRPWVAPAPAWSRALAVAVALWALWQVAVPLRTHAYGGDVLWHEQGMRWSWKVMVREKNGCAVFHVRDPKTGRSWEVTPARYLILRQEFEMAGQPDLILQMARRIAEDEGRRIGRPVEVRGDIRA